MKMRQRIRSRLWLLAVAGCIGCAQQANASLLINLVFPNGANTMTITPSQAGQDFPILVYGTVTGANPVTQDPSATTGNFDGIDFAYYSVVSNVGANGALMGNIDGGAANSAYAPLLNGQPGYGFNSAPSQPGAVQDINGDGIEDLGGSSLSQQARPRLNNNLFNNQTFIDDNPTGAADIIVGGANNNSVSFLLETIYFKVGSSLAAGESTSFNPVPSVPAPPYVPSNYFEDDPVNTGPGGIYTHTAETAGTSVQFNVVVPEPALTGIIWVFGSSLLSRRRLGALR